MRVEAGLARNTLAAYRRDLEACLGWMHKAGVKRTDGIDAERIVDWLSQLRASGKAESGLGHR